MKDNPLLTAEWILHVAERSPGYASIYHFCKAIREGQAPSYEDAEKIASALEKILFGNSLNSDLQEFAKTLELKGKQGRKRTLSSEEHEFQAAINVWLKHVDGMKLQNAKNQVAEEISDGGKDKLRSVERWFSKHNKSAKWFAEIIHRKKQKIANK